MSEGMIDAAFVVPGDIDAATGGYAYSRKVLQLLPEHGVVGHHLELPGSFPAPSADDLDRTRRLIEQIDPATPILFDGLAFGALPSGFLDGIEPPIVALVHHPLALETGLPLGRQRQLLTSEREALTHARRVIATSAYTARTLAGDYDVPPGQIVVAEPGTAPADRSIGTGAPFTILAVGSVIPRKGYGVLIDALDALGRDDWHLTIAGAHEHDAVEANHIREKILETGLRSRITLAGRVAGDALARLYARADLFVMPSYYEGYGMVLAEAMARGLAIVCTTGGAAAETAPDGAAIKVEPGNATALKDAIERVITDADLLQQMRDASWSAGQALPRWSESVAKIADVLKAVMKEKVE